MITFEIEQTTSAFREAVDRAKGHVVVLTRNGKPLYAVVDVKNEFALEALMLSQKMEFMSYLDGIADQMQQHPSEAATLHDLKAKYEVAKGTRKRRAASKKR